MAPESLVGEEISHYRILERLDEGGMGVVYHATDVRLGRDVAIKVLPVETEQNSEAVERFLREARAAARRSIIRTSAPSMSSERRRGAASW